MTPAKLARLADHPLARLALDEVRTALGQHAARLEHPAVWAAFHRARARQLQGRRPWPWVLVARAHHWRMARRYAAMLEAHEAVACDLTPGALSGRG